MKKGIIGKYAKLILVYAVCLLMILLAVGFASLTRAKDAFNREVTALNQGIIELCADAIQTQIVSPAEACAVNLMFSSDTSRLIWTILSQKEVPLYAAHRLKEKLSSVSQEYLDLISDIRVYGIHDNMILSHHLGLYYPDNHTESNCYKNTWIHDLTFSGRKWLTPRPAEYPGVSGTQLTFAYSITSGAQVTPSAGYILIDVNESAVRGLLKEMMSDDNERLFVLDSEGAVVAGTDRDMTVSDIPSVRELSAQAGVVSFTSGGNYEVLCYSAPMANGWRVCRLISANAFYASMRSMEAGILLTVGFALAVGMLLSVWFSRKLYRPVFRLTRSLVRDANAPAAQISKNEYEFIDSVIGRMRLELVDMQTRVEEDRDIVKNYLLVSLFNGATYDDITLASRMKQIGCEAGKWSCCAVVRVTLSPALANVEAEKLRVVKRDILDRLEACGDDSTAVLACEVRYDELAAVLLADSPDRSDMLDALCLRLMEQYEYHVKVSVGSWQRSMGDIHASYAAAVEVQAYQFFHPDWILCDFSTLDKTAFSGGDKLNMASAAFSEALRQRDLDGAIRALQTLSYAEQDNIYPLEEARRPLDVMTEAILQAGGGPAAPESIVQFAALARNGGFRDIREYATRMCRLLYELSGTSAPTQKNAQIIEQVRHYIDQNLHKDLSLTMLAEYVSLSGSYLSRLFKKETGESLVDYLTSARLERARQLLEQTDQSIETIALEVGYPTHHYFSRKFKERFGQTPRDWRQTNAMNRIRQSGA